MPLVAWRKKFAISLHSLGVTPSSLLTISLWSRNKSFNNLQKFRQAYAQMKLLKKMTSMVSMPTTFLKTVKLLIVLLCAVKFYVR